jgi:hypothetical protein
MFTGVVGEGVLVGVDGITSTGVHAGTSFGCGKWSKGNKSARQSERCGAGPAAGGTQQLPFHRHKRPMRARKLTLQRRWGGDLWAAAAVSAISVGGSSHAARERTRPRPWTR